MNLEPRALILAAFRQAAEAGKSPTEMTPAVLKNRMLQLSERAFDETALGFSTFADFLESNNELVEVDRSSRPTVARLLESAPGVVAGKAPSIPDRVRPDLWQAIMDYSSGRAYVWDKDAQLARQQPTAEPDDLVLPTTNPAELSKLRLKFESDHKDTATLEEQERLTRWVQEGLSTRALPGRLRGHWNRELKRHAIDKLKNWFSENQLAMPPDMIATVEKPQRSGSSKLRNWVHAVVDEMTEQELLAINLPTRATLRASRR